MEARCPLKTLSLIFLFIYSSIAVKAESNDLEDCQAGDPDAVVEFVTCLDDQVRELDELALRIQNRVLARIDIKYLPSNSEKAKRLRSKFQDSISIWYRYRSSFCDLESVHVIDEDERLGFIKECLISLTKSRIEELRLLQLHI